MQTGLMSKPERSAHFPAIEKKYGQPMKYWFEIMREIKDWKYPEQISYLRENYGFSQSHANAVVMYSRGSKTTRKFNSLDDYLKGEDKIGAQTVREIFAVILRKYPKSEVVIAWNKPMVKIGDDYIFGVTILKRHLLLAPWGTEVLDQFRPRLDGYVVLKKTFQVPLDWKIDRKLVLDMVAARISSLK